MILDVLTTIAGVAMALGYYPQAYKIWKHKSADNVSLFSYYLFAAGTFLWTLYGFYLDSIVIIISFLPGVIGSWTVVLLTWHYNKKNASIINSKKKK